jgi:hypothetical protein
VSGARTFTVPGGGDPFAIPLPFDPREAWGKAHAPVVVQVGAITYRSTVTTMGGGAWIPFRKDRRAASGLVEGEPFAVTLTLDTAPRTVDAPEDLRTALEAAGAWAAWEKLSFTHQREHVEAVEGAKKLETRERRIARCVTALSKE